MIEFNELIDFIRKEFNRELNKYPIPKKPRYLYDPIRYTLKGAGKRIRPILVHLSGRAFQGDPDSIMKIALSVELVHNFTLIHDDIMDNDDKRRGKPTVHYQWDNATAILAGDGIFTMSQLIMSSISEQTDQLLRFFNQASLEVCEGQAMDKEYENNLTITSDDYLEMIEKKTGALLGACAALPAVLCDRSDITVEAMDIFGRNLGKGFQIHDDLLEIFGDPDKMGKSLGSDITEGKQTLMVIIAREHFKEEWAALSNDKGKKLEDYRNFFSRNEIEKEVRESAREYFKNAVRQIETLPHNHQIELKNFISMVQNRSS